MKKSLARFMTTGKGKNESSAGFSAIELLITLFVAAAFITTGYMLYSTIVKDSANTRSKARATMVANEYLDLYRMSAGPCAPAIPLNEAPHESDELYKAIVTVVISCPNPSTTNVTLVTVTVSYDTPRQSIELASYGNAY